MCSAAMSFSLENSRSATMPMKKGDTIAAIAIAAYEAATSLPLKCSVVPTYVPIVTNHTPQTKNWRNIITESLVLIT